MLPAKDPFCQPPPGYEHARPGTVLRSRDVELAFLGLIPQQFTATQLLYRTTDLNGFPQATVTTVIVPTERTADGPCPVVSYQCAIDAVAGRCFPSYALRLGAKAVGALAQFEFFLVVAALAEGWAVSVPDHEGPKGTWGAPYEPGYHVLDGVRAVLQSERLGLSPDAPVGLWGYSGGGLASAWAAEVSGSYAPELNIVGAVLGSPVADLGHAFRRLNGSRYSGLPAMVVAALSHIYPELDRVLGEHATEEGKAMLLRIEKMTTAHAVVRLIGMDMGKLVDQPLEQILQTPEVQQVFESIKLGTAVPTPPVLIVQAVHDRIVSVDDIDELTHTYQSGGASVTYHRDVFSEHMLLHPMSAPMTLRWLTDRFNGKPLTEHLVRTTWPTLLNPMTYVGMARLVKIAAKVVTGRTVERRPL
jgi:triacylglycerol lipase